MRLLLFFKVTFLLGLTLWVLACSCIRPNT